MIAYNCTECQDTGKRILPNGEHSNCLDCSCEATTERAAMDLAAMDYIQAYQGDLQHAPEDVRWFVHQRAGQMEREAQAARIAELERQLAEASAPAIEQQSKINAELLLVARYALEYIDGIPKDIEVDASGFDRDWANSVVGRAKLVSPQVADTDKVREAILALPCLGTMSQFAKLDDLMLYQQGHKDALHDAASLVSSMAAQAPVREVPENWQLVPKTITHAMAKEINLTGTFTDAALQVRYSAMLDAAPLPAAPVQQEGEKP